MQANKAENILVIYDQMDGSLHYFLTQDREFLELNGVKINDLYASEKLEDKAMHKLFNHPDNEAIDWQPLTQLPPSILPSIGSIVCITFVP